MINSTPGDSAADSYVSLAEAEIYFSLGNHFQSALWTSLATSQKEAALKTAVRQLDRVNFFGRKLNYSQSLEWPRVRNTNYGTFKAIPKKIKEAQMEQALHLAKNSGAEPNGLQGVSSLKLGDLAITYGGSAGSAAVADTVRALCPEAQALLKGLWTSMGHVVATDRESLGVYPLDPVEEPQREQDSF